MPPTPGRQAESRADGLLPWCDREKRKAVSSNTAPAPAKADIPAPLARQPCISPDREQRDNYVAYAALMTEELLEFLDLIPQTRIIRQLALDLADCVQNRGVVAVAEAATDFRQ